jgi:hypothetical protein
MMSRELWTVEARDPNADDPAVRDWTIWTEWVDRATAEVEMGRARDDGYQARIVRSR